ncbi:MAG: cell envelope integrity protein TolA, partial [Pseudomonadales bacterium]|nr:cell envelope integrity protein TolA [Pseudomonadales bacterium]
AERQRQAEAERQRQAEAEKQRQAEAEKQRQAEAETERQAEAERQRQAEAAEAERQRQAQAAANAGAETAATNLQGLIVALISENWTRPPSARNGMTAVVEIRMTPTGEIVSITITQSSGDAAFDRSVEQAVRRVGRIPEMRDLPNSVFERTFRAFTLTFTPEDLLR